MALLSLAVLRSKVIKRKSQEPNIKFQKKQRLRLYFGSWKLIFGIFKFYPTFKTCYMNWFLAKIVYRIVCGDGDHTAQFDEQLRLIQANHETQAFEKAKAIGEQEQEMFLNQQQKLVQWQFVDVCELYKISALIDGAELYSRIQETDNANLYVEMVHKKAAHIKSNSTHKFLQLF
jgi:hypothetical protein